MSNLARKLTGESKLSRLASHGVDTSNVNRGSVERLIKAFQELDPAIKVEHYGRDFLKRGWIEFVVPKRLQVIDRHVMHGDRKCVVYKNSGYGKHIRRLIPKAFKKEGVSREKLQVYDHGRTVRMVFSSPVGKSFHSNDGKPGPDDQLESIKRLANQAMGWTAIVDHLGLKGGDDGTKRGKSFGRRFEAEEGYLRIVLQVHPSLGENIGYTFYSEHPHRMLAYARVGWKDVHHDPVEAANRVRHLARTLQCYRYPQQLDKVPSIVRRLEMGYRRMP